MGVRGLTTYINQNNEKYFENHKLSNCHLIVDGNSLAAVLFTKVCRNSAFGGDYDTYGHCIERCFKDFKKCGVVPVVVFDGGCEKKKLRTTRKRCESKILSLAKVGPCSSSGQAFPLMMRKSFREVLVELDVAFVQSDFEADAEIAALAKKLNCPVLSNDSDFFIFDVLYIPLSSLSFSSVSLVAKEKFIPCAIYRVDRFLESFGLSKSMLPLLATLLGNDYIERHRFNTFFNYVKTKKGKKPSQVQARIGGLLEWLRKETFDSALKKILSHTKKERQHLLNFLIKKTIKGYTNYDTPLEEYLPHDIKNHLKPINEISQINSNELEVEFDDKYVASDNEEDISGDDDDDEVESECLSTEESIDEESEVETDEEDDNYLIPQWLLEEARKGRIPSTVITVLSLKTLFATPQMEDHRRVSSAVIGLPILRVMAGLLIGNEPMKFWYRSSNSLVRSLIEPITQTTDLNAFPPLKDMPLLPNGRRAQILLDSVQLNEDVLIGFPDNWKIFILAFLYWAKNNEDPYVRPFHAHGVIFMLIVVNIVCQHVGPIKNKNPFMKRYGGHLKTIVKTKSHSQLPFHEDETIEVAISKVPSNECLLIFESLLPYFHLDSTLLARPQIFDKNLVHIFAQLQTCIVYLDTLNSVLLWPYNSCVINKFYNGTFLYNFAWNLSKRSNISAYIETFLVKAPSLYNVYRKIFRVFEKYDRDIFVQIVKPKKKKKPAVKKKVMLSHTREEEIIIESDSFIDENNPYSILSSTCN